MLLVAFNIISLCLVFVSLISMYLGIFPFGFILYRTLCASWIWLTISFSMLGKFWNIISSKFFSYPFFFSSYSGTPIIQTGGVWYCPRSVGYYPQFFSFLLLYFVFRSYFHHFIFQLTDSFFCFRYSAIDFFQSIFNFSNCVVYLCMFIR